MAERITSPPVPARASSPTAAVSGRSASNAAGMAITAPHAKALASKYTGSRCVPIDGTDQEGRAKRGNEGNRQRGEHLPGAMYGDGVAADQECGAQRDNCAEAEEHARTESDRPAGTCW